MAPNGRQTTTRKNKLGCNQENASLQQSPSSSLGSRGEICNRCNGPDRSIWRILMPELIAGLIDVFADEPLTGNPLAVVQAADELSEEQMRRLAGEFNQADTPFILERARADRELRSFTASGAEVFGAGHNALGAWLWLGEHGDLGSMAISRSFQQEIGSDVLPIEL